MNPLLLHPATERQLVNLSGNQPLLLYGPASVGKTSAAQQLIAERLGIQPGRLDNHPYVLIINADDQPGGIEAVRTIGRFLAKKVSNMSSHSSAVARAVIVQAADRLGIEAQNALLKTLEEPPADTLIILLAEEAAQLLPTVRSRTHAIEFLPPLPADLQRWLSSQELDKTAIASAAMLSGGMPGLALALAQDADHELRAAAAQARQLLGSDTFARLVQVDALAKQPQQLALVLGLCEKMARFALAHGKDTADTQIRHWQRVYTAAHQTRQALAANAQVKLALTSLMLAL